MPISIKEIHVQNLGPIRGLDWKLGKLNLIYGRNENGKTFLVEFLIRSLFKQARKWDLRSNSGTGMVRIAGLEAEQLVEFSPLLKKKLEDYLEKRYDGLPPDFLKLLVVKGAEVDIASVDGGVDKAILKNLLSSQQILDRIQKNISRTIQETTFECGLFTGPKRGELQKRVEKREHLSRLDDLLKRLDQSYSRGEQKLLSQRKQQLELELQLQLQAKRHLAYGISRDIEALKARLAEYDREKLQNLQQELVLFRRKQQEQRQKQLDCENAAAKSEHYSWLAEARMRYEDLLQHHQPKPKPYWLILAVLSVAASGVFIYLMKSIAAGATLAGALFFAALHLRLLHKQLKTMPVSQELQDLKRVFFEKFQQELTGLTDIQNLLQTMEDDHRAAQVLKKQLQEEQVQLFALQQKIAREVEFFVQQKVAPAEWEAALAGMEKKIESLQQELHEKEIALAQTAVDPSDYLTESPGVTFSQHRFLELQKQLQSVEDELRQNEGQARELKLDICRETRDDFGTPWDELIAHLRDRREAALAEYKSLLAELAGKLAVWQTLTELRRDEDAKIASQLRSGVFQQPLYQMTGRYHSMSLEDDRIVVSDKRNSFYLTELSTGAQEQILLALRIGLSANLMRKEQMFLILDDAFQYSDWQRRKLLVAKTAQLAQSGWQIVYFTMDDQIRELFQQKADDFGEDFRYYELTAEQNVQLQML